MANNYLQFSEVIPKLQPAEEEWLEDQLDTVYVFDGHEYPQDNLPSGKDLDAAEFKGCRAFRDLEDCDSSDEDAGFSYEFGTDDDEPGGWGRHLWLYAEEGGDVERVAHLVRKFLNKFRPSECWALTYSETCSKPRVAEFGGGAVFVTAHDIKWQSAYSFIGDERAAFEKRQVEPVA